MNDRIPANRTASPDQPESHEELHVRRVGGTRPAGQTGQDTPNIGIAEAWMFIDLFVQRRRSFFIAMATMAGLCLLAGLWKWKTTYTASAQLIHYDSPNADEVFPPRQMTSQILANLLHAPQLLHQVGLQSRPPLSDQQISAAIRVIAERNTDDIVVIATSTGSQSAIDLANRYARECVHFTQQLQAQSAGDVEAYLKKQLTQVEKDIPDLYRQLRFAMPSASGRSSAGSTGGPVASMDRLLATREELFDLLSRYTEAHPLVIAQRAKLAAIEKELLPSVTAAAKPPTAANATGTQPDGQATSTNSGEAVKVSDHEIVRSKLQSLESARLLLASRLRAAQTFVESPPGYCRVFADATPQDVVVHSRNFKVILVTLLGALAGMAGVAGSIVGTELMDNRLKTAADVRRVTRLPVLATMSDLKGLSQEDRAAWAFRTWTALQNQLSPSPNHGLVCGITSANAREGRSTWLHLLAEAAHRRGFRVLTIATRPTPDGAGGEMLPGPGEKEVPVEAKVGQSHALTSNVLATPALVTQRLMDNEGQPLVHIPLPGWVWNLERRKQWQAALQHWREIDNLVILIELPPASVAEAVLLAENLPNVIWLADSGHTEAAEARTQLQTLRHARCHLAGAVLNRESESLANSLFPRWFDRFNHQPV